MKMKNLSLLVMAAGAGSRFGGLKQIEPVGKNGELLLDYSVYDALCQGFEKIVFVIKPEMEKDFRALIGKRWETHADVRYAFQRGNELPQGILPPDGRAKPWGTVQAVLAAKSCIDGPFVVINSDDYYGKSAYGVVARHFETSDEMCMVAYELEKTLSDNGTVTRGVCDIKDGYLAKIEEHYNIDKNTSLAPSTRVSMNLWGFMPDIFDKMENGFCRFLKNMKNPEKDEYILPSFVGELIRNENARVRVLESPDKWIGMTYREDLQAVRTEIAALGYTFGNSFNA